MNFSFVYVFLINLRTVAPMPTTQNPTDLLQLDDSSNEPLDPVKDEIVSPYSTFDLSTDTETSFPSPDNPFPIKVESEVSNSPSELLAASPDPCGSEENDTSDGFQKSLIRKSSLTENVCPNPALSDQPSPNPSRQKQPAPSTGQMNNIIHWGGSHSSGEGPRCPKERQTPACCGLKNTQPVTTGSSVSFNLGLCLKCQ